MKELVQRFWLVEMLILVSIVGIIFYNMPFILSILTLGIAVIFFPLFLLIFVVLFGAIRFIRFVINIDPEK